MGLFRFFGRVEGLIGFLVGVYLFRGIGSVRRRFSGISFRVGAGFGGYRGRIDN